MHKAWAFRFAIPLAMAGLCVVGAQQKDTGLSFFITSVGSGKGADLGGLDGADRHCQQLAQAMGSGGRTWRAYLSAGGGKPVNAKDRIGAGPWQNVKGVVVPRCTSRIQMLSPRSIRALSSSTVVSNSGGSAGAAPARVAGVMPQNCS